MAPFTIFSSCFLIIFICNNRCSDAKELRFVLLSDSSQSVSHKAALAALRTINVSVEVISVELLSNTVESELCERMFEGTSTKFTPPAIFMLDLSQSSTLGKSMARRMGVPSLRTSSLAQALQDNVAWKNLNLIEQEIYISMLTPEATMLQMIKDIATHYRYKAVVLIYDNTFKKAHEGHIIKNLKHRSVYWPSLSNETIKSTFNELKKTSLGTSFFVVGSITTLSQVMEQANLHYMFGTYRPWYFISKEKGRVECVKCHHVEVFWSQPLKSRLHYYEHEPSSDLPRDSAAIVDIYFYYDLARLYAQTVTKIVNVGTFDLTYPTCGRYLTEGHMRQRENLRLYEELSQNFLYGMFGQFMFNRNSRLNYQELSMRINRVTMRNGSVAQSSKVAEWEFEDQLGRLYFSAAQEKSKRPGIPHYQITTIIEAPFIMEVTDNFTKGNERFYGYCIDLLKEIVNNSDFKFEYTISVVPDHLYGHKNEKGEWTGMIGELVSKKADIALGPISVMAEREIVVDFTVPYYDLVGITILMKKPTVPSHLFKFLTVLETNVWLCILAAYFFTSFLMYLFDRLSPYSFHNNREKYKDDEEQREFTLKECLWFCMTSLTPQGGGEAPRNLSGRLVAATWWLFGFIIIASYTANLAAFLTVSRLDSPIDSLDDLAKQYKIKYAPQAGTATATYFERMAGIEEKFYEIWKDMSLNDSLSDDERAKLAVWDYPVSDKYTKIWSQILEAKMPQSMAEGLRRVKNEDPNGEQFAFITDSTLVKYAVMTNCDLQNIGNEFSRKPIALAVQQNSDLKDKLSSAILKLLNQRRLENLKEKWWNRNPEKKDCQDSKKQSDGISINNIGGVFIVIFIGVVLACVTLLIEYWYFKGKESKVITLQRDPATVAMNGSIKAGSEVTQGKVTTLGYTLANGNGPGYFSPFNQQDHLNRQLRTRRDFSHFSTHH